MQPLAVGGAAVILWVGGLVLHSNVGAVVLLGTVAVLLTSRLHPALVPWVHPSEERGVVAIAPSGDWSWNGAIIARRSRIRQALVVPPTGDEAALLRVELLGADALEFRVRLAEARRFLEAAQLDATSSVATFAVASRAETNAVSCWILRGAPVAFLAMGFLFGSVEIGLLTLPAIAVLVIAFGIPTRVRVGADAVEWRWLFWRTRVGYRDLRAARYGDGEIVLERRDGARVVLRSGTDREHVAMHRRLRERLERALGAQHRTNGAQAFDLATLDRHGAPVEEWLGRLRALGAASTQDYRAAPPDPSAMFEVVHDTTASPARRAAALVATGDALDDDRRARIAASARAMLDTDLRAAFEAVLSSDDAALRRAMAALTREGVID